MKIKGGTRTVYLSGSQQFAEDAYSWRQECEDRLIKLGLAVANPTKFEVECPDKLKQLHAAGDFYNLHKHMEIIVDQDLEELDVCKSCLVYWDKGVYQGAGTKGEITLCRAFGIPVFIVLNEHYSIADLPWWIIGCVSSIGHIYKSFDEFFNSLEFKKWLNS
jgi:nucleoside 2-deoxyribosyltransferase